METITKEQKRVLGVLYHDILSIPPQERKNGRDLILKVDVAKLILDAMST
ncbi:MAG: hypothetical protein M0Q91_18730 [Methanoregula sp.]|jgi:hypothetical protein|nr:hypothetical protein [Methanoregula sp.]